MTVSYLPFFKRISVSPASVALATEKVQKLLSPFSDEIFSDPEYITFSNQLDTFSNQNLAQLEKDHFMKLLNLGVPDDDSLFQKYNCSSGTDIMIVFLRAYFSKNNPNEKSRLNFVEKFLLSSFSFGETLPANQLTGSFLLPLQFWVAETVELCSATESHTPSLPPLKLLYLIGSIRKLIAVRMKYPLLLSPNIICVTYACMYSASIHNLGTLRLLLPNQTLSLNEVKQDLDFMKLIINTSPHTDVNRVANAVSLIGKSMLPNFEKSDLTLPEADQKSYRPLLSFLIDAIPTYTGPLPDDFRHTLLLLSKVMPQVFKEELIHRFEEFFGTQPQLKNGIPDGWFNQLILLELLPPNDTVKAISQNIPIHIQFLEHVFTSTSPANLCRTLRETEVWGYSFFRYLVLLNETLKTSGDLPHTFSNSLTTSLGQFFTEFKKQCDEVRALTPSSHSEMPSDSDVQKKPRLDLLAPPATTDSKPYMPEAIWEELLLVALRINLFSATPQDYLHHLTLFLEELTQIKDSLIQPSSSDSLPNGYQIVYAPQLSEQESTCMQMYARMQTAFIRFFNVTAAYFTANNAEHDAVNQAPLLEISPIIFSQWYSVFTFNKNNHFTFEVGVLSDILTGIQKMVLAIAREMGRIPADSQSSSDLEKLSDYCDWFQKFWNLHQSKCKEQVVQNPLPFFHLFQILTTLIKSGSLERDNAQEKLIKLLCDIRLENMLQHLDASHYPAILPVIQNLLSALLERPFQAESPISQLLIQCLITISNHPNEPLKLKSFLCEPDPFKNLCKFCCNYIDYSLQKCVSSSTGSSNASHSGINQDLNTEQLKMINRLLILIRFIYCQPESSHIGLPESLKLRIFQVLQNSARQLEPVTSNGELLNLAFDTGINCVCLLSNNAIVENEAYLAPSPDPFFKLWSVIVNHATQIPQEERDSFFEDSIPVSKFTATGIFQLSDAMISQYKSLLPCNPQQWARFLQLTHILSQNPSSSRSAMYTTLFQNSLIILSTLCRRLPVNMKTTFNPSDSLPTTSSPDSSKKGSSRKKAGKRGNNPQNSSASSSTPLLHELLDRWLPDTQIGSKKSQAILIILSTLMRYTSDATRLNIDCIKQHGQSFFHSLQSSEQNERYVVDLVQFCFSIDADWMYDHNFNLVISAIQSYSNTVLSYKDLAESDAKKLMSYLERMSRLYISHSETRSSILLLITTLSDALLQKTSGILNREVKNLIFQVINDLTSLQLSDFPDMDMYAWLWDKNEKLNQGKKLPQNKQSVITPFLQQLAYSPEMRQEILKLTPETIAQYGALKIDRLMHSVFHADMDSETRHHILYLFSSTDNLSKFSSDYLESVLTDVNLPFLVWCYVVEHLLTTSVTTHQNREKWMHHCWRFLQFNLNSLGIEASRSREEIRKSTPIVFHLSVYLLLSLGEEDLNNFLLMADEFKTFNSLVENRLIEAGSEDARLYLNWALFLIKVLCQRHNPTDRILSFGKSVLNMLDDLKALDTELHPDVDPDPEVYEPGQSFRHYLFPTR